MLDILENHIAHSVQEACACLDADAQAIVVAGGTDVLIKIREGKLAGARLVSIGDILELKGVSMKENGDLVIGPLTTFTELEENPLIQKNIPLLAMAAGTVGGPQIRAAGTIGGNICNGVTSADTASPICALNARLTARSASGEREYSIHEHYAGVGKVTLQHGELLTAITIPASEYQGYRGSYTKYAMRNAMDIATLSCAVWLRTNETVEVLEDIRIACGVAAPVPMRAFETERTLKGLRTEEALQKAPALIRREVNPRDSWRASRKFRLHIIGEILQSTMNEALVQGGRIC